VSCTVSFFVVEQTSLAQVLSALLEVYGPCISTASWTEWPRHRKVLAAPFNETVMTFVWAESVKQATQMLDSWSANNGSITSYSKDTRMLSLNVLAATGFKRSYNFASSESVDGEAGSTSYRDALQIVLDNIVTVMLVPPRLLLLPIVPKSWRKIGVAANDFKDYMVDMLREETRLFEQGQFDKGGLMTGFLRASRGPTSVTQSPQLGAIRSDQTLSTQEIYGNIFVINFAGHDTTANTLAFSLLLLSVHPEVQAWLAEEIDYVNKLHGKIESWTYVECFSKLKRCRALMLETLRLFPPIMAIPKRTNSRPQSIRVGERLIILPPKTFITPGPLAIQTLPEYWDEPLEWRPQRWIIRASVSGHGSPTSSGTQFEDEELFTPRQGTYLPWSDGPQNCPGLKFSQVEFVAVLATLFQQHRVSVVLNPGEAEEQGRRRAMATSQDCDMLLLLRLRNPDSVSLRCKVARGAATEHGSTDQRGRPTQF
jgi:cytochrome P450